MDLISLLERTKEENNLDDFFFSVDESDEKSSYQKLCLLLSEERVSLSRQLYKDFASFGLKVGVENEEWKLVGCKDRLSFSELVNWEKCPYYHKIVNIDKIGGFRGNHFSAFGSAIHLTIEELLNKQLTEQEAEDFFQIEFQNRLKKVESFDEKIVAEMIGQSSAILPYVTSALKDTFGEYELISTEMRIYEAIRDCHGLEFDFKGFIDLAVKTSDGRYHLIDWKTTSWGWKPELKTDRMKTYQLTLYKHFFCEMTGINPADVDVHFALLKRTAKRDNVEIFQVDAGKRKVRNALTLLKRAAYNVANKRFVKNKLSCSDCEFFRTQHCTR